MHIVLHCPLPWLTYNWNVTKKYTKLVIWKLKILPQSAQGFDWISWGFYLLETQFLRRKSHPSFLNDTVATLYDRWNVAVRIEHLSHNQINFIYFVDVALKHNAVMDRLSICREIFKLRQLQFIRLTKSFTTIRKISWPRTEPYGNPHDCDIANTLELLRITRWEFYDKQSWRSPCS